MFTTFLLLMSLAIVGVLATVLALRWKSVPAETRVPFAPIAVAGLAAALVALGFLVI